jgi:hypothetical protein
MSLQYYCTIRVHNPASTQPISFWYELPYFDLIDSARPGMVLERSDTAYDDTQATAQIMKAFEQIKRTGGFRFPVPGDNANGVFALQTALDQGYVADITIGLLRRGQTGPPKPIQGGLKLDLAKIVSIVPYRGTGPQGTPSGHYYVVTFQRTESQTVTLVAPA